MKFRWLRFNSYLLLALAVLFTVGCRTEAGKRKRQLATLRLHIEVNPDATGRSEQVPIYRSRPIKVNVEKQPFATEILLDDAKVQETMGSFELRLQFERRGTWLLEQYTGANRGKHLAIFSQWTEQPGGKLNEGRWLAAPLIQKRITDGVLVFTPDATRQETDTILLGLTNVIRQVKKGVKF